jgi:hypothetical protein
MRTTIERARARLLASLAVLALVAGTGLMTGCSRPRDPAAELEVEIQRYRQDPSDALASRIDASFAQLDADVAQIRADAQTKEGDARVAALARADALQERGGQLRKEYYGARVDQATAAAKNAVQEFGQKVGKGLERAGEKIQGAMGGGDKTDD